MPCGKCDTCRVRWQWCDRPRVADATCPICKRRLAPVSQNSLLPQLSAYATTGMARSGPKYLTADPTEVSRVRRNLRRKNGST